MDTSPSGNPRGKQKVEDTVDRVRLQSGPSYGSEMWGYNLWAFVGRCPGIGEGALNLSRAPYRVVPFCYGRGV
ncbi:hypothetical protein NDU88_002999 [Pleurodeles waltl]|uniref:Uncharacterized protein n=1 Tax=Pleurodeles waltl TaxID=8319 RepID=A0AAV7UCJ1_PLEWA|nr:hypothetical protein NDU88_002999 [Pleurodeles waltl]